MCILPKIKATISAFLLGEEGKISKQAGLALGSFVFGASVATTLSSEVAISDGGCGCGCGCGCIEIPITIPIHSSSVSLGYEDGIEISNHYSHTSV